MASAQTAAAPKANLEKLIPANEKKGSCERPEPCYCMFVGENMFVVVFYVFLIGHHCHLPSSDVVWLGCVVLVHFRALSNAPQMKKNKFFTGASSPFSAVIDFLRRQLKFNATDPLVGSIVPLCRRRVKFTILLDDCLCSFFMSTVFLPQAQIN
jgi:hypothetical protein